MEAGAGIWAAGSRTDNRHLLTEALPCAGVGFRGS